MTTDDGQLREWFGLLEEAAVLLQGRRDQEEMLELCHLNLQASLLKHSGDAALAERLSSKFAEIIDRRRVEIELAAGAALQNGTVQ